MKDGDVQEVLGISDEELEEAVLCGRPVLGWSKKDLAAAALAFHKKQRKAEKRAMAHRIELIGHGAIPRRF